MRVGVETHNQTLCKRSLNWRSPLGSSAWSSGNPEEEAEERLLRVRAN
ncbi:rCG57647 [Rattus norvegicus]|uniref:RCG57647 n=1 Tax=Rattus norvegicus TaxID=10116 RepID=A6JHX1_RAT|nr:rCG57647 [Rattus norvegicus]